MSVKQGAVAQVDRASASWSIGHYGGNSIDECGQIQGSLKSYYLFSNIYDQGNLEPSFMFPGKEGAETNCRLKKPGRYYQV